MYIKTNPSNGISGFRGMGAFRRRGLGASGPQYSTPNNLPQVTADGFTIPRVTQNIHFPGDPMNVYRGFPMPGTPIDPNLAPIIAQYGGRTSDGTNPIMPVRDDSQPSHVAVVPPPAGTQDYAPGSAAYAQVQDTIIAIKAQIAGDATQQSSAATKNIPCVGALYQNWTASQGGYQAGDGTQAYYPGTPGAQQAAANGCSWGWFNSQDPNFVKYGAPNTIYFAGSNPLDPSGNPMPNMVAIAPGTPVVKSQFFNAYQYQLGGGGSVAQPSLPAPVAPPPPIPAAALPPLPAPVPAPASVPSPANPITNFFQMISGGGQNSPGTPLPPQFQPQPPQMIVTGGPNIPTPPQAAQPVLPMVPAVQSIPGGAPNQPVSSAPASSSGGFDLSSLTSSPWLIAGIAAVALLMFSQGGRK